MFRLRLACSILTGKAIRIDDIRSLDEQPGLRGTRINRVGLDGFIVNIRIHALVAVHP